MGALCLDSIIQTSSLRSDKLQVGEFASPGTSAGSSVASASGASGKWGASDGEDDAGPTPLFRKDLSAQQFATG